MPTAHHVFLIVAVAACATAAVTDLRTGTIPNWLTLGVFAAAPLAHAAIALPHHPWTSGFSAAGSSVAGGIGAAVVPLLLARSGGLGLGDVKLFAAIGATCGVFAAMYAQTYAYVFGVFYALFLMWRQGRLKSTLANVRGLLAGNRSAPRESFTEVRFAPAILVGMCATAWMQWRVS